MPTLPDFGQACAVIVDAPSVIPEMGLPTMLFNRVVLPAPDGPIKAIMSPAWTKQFTASRSFLPPATVMLNSSTDTFMAPKVRLPRKFLRAAWGAGAKPAATTSLEDIGTLCVFQFGALSGSVRLPQAVSDVPSRKWKH